MNRKGFSLTELMVVVAIIGVLSALAAPNFVGLMRKQAFASAVNNLQGNIKIARQTAMAEGWNTGIAFGVGASNRYVIFRDRGTTDKKYDASDLIRYTYKLSNDGSIVFNPNIVGKEIIFDSRGRVIVNNLPVDSSLDPTGRTQSNKAIVIEAVDPKTGELRGDIAKMSVFSFTGQVVLWRAN